MTKVIAVALFFAAGSVAAEEGKIDFKKTEKGAGELFRGMGQEIQRSGILGNKDAKKDEKKAAKKVDAKDAPKKDAAKKAKEPSSSGS